jgi:hypothetical protein
LLRRFFCAAVALLVVNDHVLKGAGVLPGWLTGKLSDFAGLFFFPILLVTLAAWFVGRRAWMPAAASWLTGAVFAGLKLSPMLALWATRVWGPVVCDPSDLVALPSLLAAHALMVRVPYTSRVGRERVGQAASVVLAALASLATSAPPQRAFPAWKLSGNHAGSVGCTSLEAWVSKSGKQGLGVTLAARGQDACIVNVVDAHIVLAGADRIAAARLPPPLAAGGYVYIPFAFDNEAQWNAGRRTGDLVLDLVAGDDRVTLRMPMIHTWTGPHEPRSHATTQAQ